MNILDKKAKNKRKISKENFRLVCGFTLVEILIAIAVISTVSVVGLVGYFHYRNSQNLKLSANELATVVRDTQKKSVTQQDGKQWGVHFENLLDESGRFSVFNSALFGVGTTTQTISLRRGVVFGSPYVSSTYDIHFAPITGLPSEGKIISLFPSGEKNISADIIVNALGKTTLRMENGLVGYWHFDEGVGTTTYDASGNGNNGTLVNSPTWQPGTNCKSGSCLSFDGSGNYINILNSPILNLTGPFTISFWMKSNSLIQTNKYIFGKLNNAGDDIIYAVVYGYASGKIQFYDSAGSAYGYPLSNSDISISDTNWHHIVYSYDGTFFRGYIDDNAITPVSATANFSASSGALNIGTFNATGFYFNGLLDEFRIYNRALSADEVKSIYEDLK